MKITNGKILVFFGIIHPLLGISPILFGKQFVEFSKKYFFKIGEGILESPVFNGQIKYENHAAFWFFYFGLLLIPIGILVDSIEKENTLLPKKFIWSYLIVVTIGVYMLPYSGMTVFMLPHAIFMLVQRNKQRKLKSVMNSKS